MSTAEIFTVIVALLALLVNVVFVTFQVTWTLAKDQKDKRKSNRLVPTKPKRLLFFSEL